MTPLTLARDPVRAIAYLRDVVGYGRLPGETSDLEVVTELSVAARAAVLAWYWPQPGYEEAFDPFVALDDPRAQEARGRDPQLALRVLAADRLEGFIAAASGASLRAADEVAAAVCWGARCSGDRLLGVLKGQEGLSFHQFLDLAAVLGLHFVDPTDEDARVERWTSAIAELRAKVADAVKVPVRAAVVSARQVLVDRAAETLQRDLVEDSAIPAVWSRLSERWRRFDDEPLDLAIARRALHDRTRLADRARIAEVVADLSLDPASADHAEAVVLLQDLLGSSPTEWLEMVCEALQAAAGRLDAFNFEPDGTSEGFGWLLMDRPHLGERVDTAVAELASISEARAAIRGITDGVGGRPPMARPGDVYHAPAPGTRYRALYEALASSEVSAPTLKVDPAARQIRTARGWIALPSSAVRERAWWSGSGQSVTGRPQLRAWWAAGYGPPELVFNDDGLVVAVTFSPLTGRSEWLQKSSLEERLSRGTYQVPVAPSTPYHAAFSYDGPDVWHMDDERYGALAQAFRVPATAVSADHGQNHEAHAALESDAEQIERLVKFLRNRGESGRREIEAFFTSGEAGAVDALEVRRGLPNLLAKARRQGKIVNIGTRKQPRWIAAGTSAHLAARLARALGQDQHGNRVAKVVAPKVGPRDPVPADLCRDAIRHVFPNLAAAPVTPAAPLRGEHNGRSHLTDAAMAAVLAGRNLTSRGVELLLEAIDLVHEAAWEAAASATRDESVALELDESDVLANLEEEAP